MPYFETFITTFDGSFCFCDRAICKDTPHNVTGLKEWSVSERSDGPTPSKSDLSGRNPEMTRLVRRYSAMSESTAFFLSCSNIPSAHVQIFWLSHT